MWGLLALNVAVKLSLLGAAVFMLLNPDLPQFENKSLTMRAILYPVFAALVAIGFFWRRMPGPFPHLADFMWTFTFTFDIVSNDAHLYGSYKNYDDFVHFLNAFPYMFLLIGLLMAGQDLGYFRLGYAGILIVAFLAFFAFHAVWETWEHSLDRFLGTTLQPGGMAEATENNAASVVGALLAIGILHFWRKSSFFQRYFYLPLRLYIVRLLRVRASKVPEKVGAAG
ncbi:MAG TPA: hypothetical protein VNL15_04465 [Dehalococcoidia bacterium]|nr:hypothetical protein [Dehalococcoidia bacterium]